VFILGMASRLLSQAEFRVPRQAQWYAAGARDRAFINELTVKDVLSGRLVPFGETNTPAEPRILVWGDSHAMAVLPAFDDRAKQYGVRGVAVTHSATPPIYSERSLELGKGMTGEKAREFGQAVIQYIQLHGIRQVILVANWSTYCDRAGKPVGSGSVVVENYETLTQALAQTVTVLEKKGASVWVLEEVPRHGADVPRILARCSMWGGDADEFAATVGDPAGGAKFASVAQGALLKAGAKWVSVAPLLVAPDGEHYRMSDGGGALYRDRHHLTVRGAMFVREGLNVIFDESK